MKIAQVGPLIESVPPKFYGGTERVVSYLTEELVAQGHDVTLFASGDSITSARLVPCCKEALRLNPAVRDPIPYYMMMLDRVRRMAPKFDVLHFHIDQFHFPIFHAVARKTLTTLHGRQDLPDLQQLYHAFPEMGVVSISNAQRNPIPSANFAGTVYHGIPQHLHKPTFTPRGGYLAFLGRISFSLYLIHVPIMFSLGCYLYLYVFNSFPQQLLYTFLTTVSFTLVCSYFFYLYIDKKSLKLSYSIAQKIAG